jgi:photosystem II stability/assembly factor-like uncharacterized protein
VYAGTDFDGVMKSTDSGRSWRAAHAGLGTREIGTLVIDPTAPDVVYAAVEGSSEGVYKTTNGALRWRFSGLNDNFVEALVIAPNTPATLFAAVWDPALSGSGEDRIVKSIDGGRRWVEPRPGFISEYVPALAVDPRRSSIVYAGTDRGVYKTTDGGTQWRAIGLTGVGQINAIALDPRKATVIYAATKRGGVRRSTDGGRTWSQLNAGLTTLDVDSLAISSDGRRLYAGTRVGVFALRLAR